MFLMVRYTYVYKCEGLRYGTLINGVKNDIASVLRNLTDYYQFQ